MIIDSLNVYKNHGDNIRSNFKIDQIYNKKIYYKIMN